MCRTLFGQKAKRYLPQSSLYHMCLCFKARKTQASAQTKTEPSADGAALTFPLTGAQLVTETLKQLSKRAEELGSPLTQEQSVGLAKFFSNANATPGGVHLNEEQVRF